MQLSVTTYAMVRTSPPGPNDSRVFREDSGYVITHGPGFRRFVLKKIAPYANGFALFLAVKFR